MKNCNKGRLEQLNPLVISQCLGVGYSVGKQNTLVTPQCFYAGYSVNKQRGFSLIELLVVVLIIGILAAVAVPQYQKAVDRARYLQAVTVLEGVWHAQQQYYLANGVWSTNFEELDIDVPIPTVKKSSNVYTFSWGGDCWIYNTYGGCTIRLGGVSTARYQIEWNGGNRSCLVNPSDNARGRALCKAVTGHEGRVEDVYYRCDF